MEPVDDPIAVTAPMLVMISQWLLYTRSTTASLATKERSARRRNLDPTAFLLGAIGSTRFAGRDLPTPNPELNLQNKAMAGSLR